MIMRKPNTNQMRASADSKLSPYSILRTTRNEDLEEEFRKSQQSGGQRNTRAEFLRHLYLKQKLENNPALKRFPKELV